MKLHLAAGAMALAMCFGNAFADEPVAAPADVTQPPTVDYLNDCACCPTPWFSVRAGVIFIERDDPEDVVLASGPEGSLNTSDFNFDYETGFEIGGIYHLNDCFGFEARYFQVDSWDDELGPVVLFDELVFETGEAEYESELRSLEFNGRYRLCGCPVTLVGGFRYLRLDEEFGIRRFLDFMEGSITSIDEVEVENNLYGFQIGAEASRCFGRLIVYGNAKAGMYYNHIDLERSFASIPEFGTPFSNETELDDDEGSFVGEVGITAEYRINCRFSILAGYQLLWIDDVALATEQGQSNSVTADRVVRAPRIDTGSSSLYHGGFLGGAVNW